MRWSSPIPDVAVDRPDQVLTMAYQRLAVDGHVGCRVGKIPMGNRKTTGRLESAHARRVGSSPARRQ